MIELKNIFPECYADTLLVQLIKQGGRPNHQHGISEVSRALKSRSDNNQTLIGIVDLDKAKNIAENKYLMEFTEVILNGKDDQASLILKKHPSKSHYLIFVHKEFEHWIWSQAKLGGVDTKTFGFNTLDELYQISKSYRTSTNSNAGQRFKKFVNAVVIADPPGVALLKKWLVDYNFTVTFSCVG